MKTLFTLRFMLASFLLVIITENTDAQAWAIGGNSVAKDTTMGTKNAFALRFITNGVERMRINPSGNIGLGTNNPQARLSIIWPDTTSLVKPGYMMLGNANSKNLSFDNTKIQARNNGVASTLYLNPLGGNIWIGDNDSLPVCRINSNSHTCNYGFIIPDTAYTLSVGPLNSQGGISVGNVYASNYPAIKGVKAGLGNSGWFESTDTSNLSSCLFATTKGKGQAIYASATGTGAEGILCRAGNGGNGIEAYPGLVAGKGYAGYFSGNVYSTGSYLGSDKKLKNNIRDFNNAMDLINKLQPKMYEYRQDGNYSLMNLPKNTQYGLIAQEVEQVLPQLVYDSKYNTRAAHPEIYEEAERQGKPIPKSEIIEFKALNYTELIPILIKGIQEQQQEIDLFKQLVKEVSKQNENLQQQVDELKALVAKSSAETSSSQSSIITVNGASLDQNMPNPFNTATSIGYTLPQKFTNAQLAVSDTNGKLLEQVSLSGTGKGKTTIETTSLAAGPYTYCLVIDGKLIASQKMILVK